MLPQLERIYWTVKVTVVVLLIPPPVPVMVMVRVPVVARRLTVMVMVDVPLPVMDVGLKPRVTLEPAPVPERLTAELKPPETVEVTVTLPEEPREMVNDAGEALRLKVELVFVTLTVTVVVSTVEPLVPETVMV